MILRHATDEDLPFLGLMMREAGFPPGKLPPLDEALRRPHVAQWLDGWIRDGDLGIVACDDDGTPIGAAWCRLFRDDGYPNYGFVDRNTPVVAIAVTDGRRGRGIGAALLGALADASRAQGRRALSLNVGRTNPARRLYERLGYVVFDDDGERPLRLRLHL